MDQPLYVLSNACTDLFPNNTLTNFTNKLPSTLRLREEDNWEVGIESIGISSLFRNVLVPPPNKLSLWFFNCAYDETDYYEPIKGKEEPFCYQIPLLFDLTKRSDANPNVFGPRCASSNTFYELTDKYYQHGDISSLAGLLSVRTYHLKVSYENKKLSFTFNDRPGSTTNSKGMWVVMHETFYYNFGFKAYELQKLKMKTYRQEELPTRSIQPVDSSEHSTIVLMDPSLTSDINYQNETKPVEFNCNEASLVEIGGKQYIQRKVQQDGEIYYAFFISKDKNNKYHRELTSDVIKLKPNKLPNLIKVSCDIIEPQVLNSEYSKDLLIVAPEWNLNETYFYYQMEKTCFMPLLCNDLSEINIKLLDENNEQLQLLRGHATFLKLKFRRNPTMKESFFVRLTSEKSQIFPNNKTSKFTVQLPSTKVLNSSWKVALHSINAPNRFSTFLKEDKSQLLTLVYKQLNGTKQEKLTFSPTKAYTPTQIAMEIDIFFKTHNLGSAYIDQYDRLEFKLNHTDFTFLVGLSLNEVLGFESGTPVSKSYTALRTINSTDTITFTRPINVNYFKPNYYLIYTNIIKPTILGDKYVPLLELVPITHNDQTYVIHEFKHPRYHEIEQTSVDLINVEIRSHDGNEVNFLDLKHVILNLEFTNEPITHDR